jgi:hypothetical protein
VARTLAVGSPALEGGSPGADNPGIESPGQGCPGADNLGIESLEVGIALGWVLRHDVGILVHVLKPARTKI